MSDTTESASTMPFTPLAPVVYHFRMPRPGEAGALFFDKTNVSEFLKRWEEECEEVGYTDAQKCVKLPAYCAEETQIAIRNLGGFEEKSWVRLCGDDERVGSSCLGVCHDVPVDIGGVMVKTHVFVVKHAAQDLLLGRPWEREARAIFTNADNGDYLCTIRSQDGRRVVDFCAARGQHPRNRQHARGVDGEFPSHHLKGEGPTH